MMDEHKAECQGCGLSPNVRSGDVVIWCDECYSELRDRLARMQPVVDALSRYIESVTAPENYLPTTGDDHWNAVLEAWGKCKEHKK